MALALSTYIGKGTRTNPFRPKLEGASIDLRPDCTVPDGYALVNTEEHVRHKLGEDFKDTFGHRIRNRVHNRLGVDVSRVKRFDVLAAKLLLDPNGWGALRPTPWRYEIWLGGLVWEFPLIQGGASDDFNRANADPIGLPWVSGPSLAPAFDDPAISSNTMIAGGGGTADSCGYYLGAASTSDQYAQSSSSAPQTACGGASVRVQGDGTSAGFRMYTLDNFTNSLGGTIDKWTGETITQVVSFGTGRANPMRIEVQGTTLRAYYNDALVAGTPITDTAIPSGGQPGQFIYANSFDNWSGGDLVTASPPHFRPAMTSRGTSW